MSNSIDFIPSRDKELYIAYREHMRNRDIRSHQEAIKAAVKTRTSRFWISNLQAYREILRLKRGKPMAHTRSVRRRMIESIYSIYKELESKPAFRNCSVFFIVSFAVQQPAPEFYLSYSRATSIIYKMIRNEHRK